MTHVPMRMCIICRQRFVKTELTRYTMNFQGQLDMGQDSSGRGWYVCLHTKCREKLAFYKPGKTRRNKGTK